MSLNEFKVVFRFISSKAISLILLLVGLNCLFSFVIRRKLSRARDFTSWIRFSRALRSISCIQRSSSSSRYLSVVYPAGSRDDCSSAAAVFISFDFMFSSALPSPSFSLETGYLAFFSFLEILLKNLTIAKRNGTECQKGRSILASCNISLRLIWKREEYGIKAPL